MWAVWCGKCQLSPKTQVKPTDGWFCYKQDQSPYCVWWAWVEAGSTESSHDAQGLSEGLSTSQTGRSFIPFTSSQSSSHCAASSVPENNTAGGWSGKCPTSKVSLKPYKWTIPQDQKNTSPHHWPWQHPPIWSEPLAGRLLLRASPAGLLWRAHLPLQGVTPQQPRAGPPTPQVLCSVRLHPAALCRLQLQILTMFENKTGSRFKHLCVQTF